jgi:uncharacterized membrane protein YbaN (DUF454 family)
MNLLHQSLRLAGTAAGIVCLIIGIIGIFIPLLPTTPMVLVAAYLFSKSNQRLHDWLLRQPGLGPALTDWSNHRVIRPRAKAMATVAILVVFGWTTAFAPAPPWARVSAAFVGASLLTFILTRRSRPPTP